MVCACRSIPGTAPIVTLAAFAPRSYRRVGRLADKESAARAAKPDGRAAKIGPRPRGSQTAGNSQTGIAMTFARTFESIEAAQGLILAPVDGAGPWQAVRELRTAMQGLRADGWSPEGVFLT